MSSHTYELAYPEGGLYSPSCLEEVFLKTHIQSCAWISSYPLRRSRSVLWGDLWQRGDQNILCFHIKM